MGFESILGRQKAALLLLHPSSLPDPPGKTYGIGELGSEALRFLDFLSESGTKAWQVLPLGHTGFKDSPYQTFSRFAGSPLLISIEQLHQSGDLSSEEHDAYCNEVRNAGIQTDKVDYGWLFSHKLGGSPQDSDAVLRQAFARYLQRPDDDPRCTQLLNFIEKNSQTWLDDYAEFMAIKEHQSHRCWAEWPEPFRNIDEWRTNRDEIIGSHPELAHSILFFKYLQFVFIEQWNRIRDHAKRLDRLIIGDIPWYVGYDSADVWANRNVFALDETGVPNSVAGVPPDAFSDTGQLWGNPLYDWTSPKATQWWLRAISFILKTVDILRLDHCRAFDTYWIVPQKNVEEFGTAERGYWAKGPGQNLLNAIYDHLVQQKQIAPDGQIPIIGEDLGCFDPLYATIDDYPKHFDPKHLYPLSTEFSEMITNRAEEVKAGLDPETGEYSTRLAINALLASFSIPRMSVLEFNFEGTQTYRPEQEPYDIVCYAATHDNNTLRGWCSTALLKETAAEEKSPSLYLRVEAALRPADSEETPEDATALPIGDLALLISQKMLEVGWATTACLAGAQIQDILGLGAEARMNMPGDAHGQWWAWRATLGEMDYTALGEKLANLNAKYERKT